MLLILYQFQALRQADVKATLGTHLGFGLTKHCNGPSGAQGQCGGHLGGWCAVGLQTDRDTVTSADKDTDTP